MSSGIHLFILFTDPERCGRVAVLSDDFEKATLSAVLSALCKSQAHPSAVPHGVLRMNIFNCSPFPLPKKQLPGFTLRSDNLS